MLTTAFPHTTCVHIMYFKWIFPNVILKFNLCHLSNIYINIHMYHRKFHFLPHWGRVTHISVGNLTNSGSHNGDMSLYRRQAIIWTIPEILLIGPFGTNFRDFFYRNWYIFIQENAFENDICKKVAILSRPQCVKWSLQFPIKQQQDVYDYAIWNNKYIFRRLVMIYMLVQCNDFEMNKALNTLHTYQQLLYWFAIVECLGVSYYLREVGDTINNCLLCIRCFIVYQPK